MSTGGTDHPNDPARAELPAGASSAVSTDSASPTVSVVIPTYNSPGLLAETIATVSAQTFADFEIVVVDDGSTDDTPARLAEMAQREPRLRVVRQENRGIGAARNRGIDEARGRYVALLDHDDLWHPDKLAEQVRFMADHPDCVGCSVPWDTTTEPGRCIFDLRIAGPDGRIDRPLRQLASGHVFLISSSILFDRARAAGLRYETVRKCVEDTPFLFGLFGRGAFGIAGLTNNPGDAGGGAATGADGGGGRASRMLMTYRNHGANYSYDPDFSYHGLRMLRRQRREGMYAHFDPVAQRDLSACLAATGRWATVVQLLAGLRGRAARVYVREFLPNLREGRLRYLAMLPPLLLAPRWVLKKRWPQAGQGAPARPG